MPWLVISNTNNGEFIIDVLPLNPIVTMIIQVSTPSTYDPQALTYALTLSLNPA